MNLRFVMATPMTCLHLLAMADVLDERAKGWDGDVWQLNEDERRQYRTAADAINDAGLPMCNGKSLDECVVAMIAHIGAAKESDCAELTFSDDLVERLSRMAWDAQMEECPTWENYPQQFKVAAGIGVRACLAALAAMPVELPEQSQIRDALRSNLHGWPEDKAIEFLRLRVAHFLNAKNVRIATLEAELTRLVALHDADKTRSEELERMNKEACAEVDAARRELREEQELRFAAQDRVEMHRQETVAAAIELGHLGKTIEEAARAKCKEHDADKIRIADLERINKMRGETELEALARVDELTIANNGYRARAEEGDKTIDELGRKLTGAQYDADELREELSRVRATARPDARQLELWDMEIRIKNLKAQYEGSKATIADLEKRLAERDPGATPEYNDIELRWTEDRERAAQFLESLKTMMTKERATSGMILNAIKEEQLLYGGPTAYETPSQPHQPTGLTRSPDMLRGTFFWAMKPSELPAIYCGEKYGVSFDAIPTALRLAADDIIEIRVLERAKQ